MVACVYVYGIMNSKSCALSHHTCENICTEMVSKSWEVWCPFFHPFKYSVNNWHVVSLKRKSLSMCQYLLEITSLNKTAGLGLAENVASE